MPASSCFESGGRLYGGFDLVAHHRDEAVEPALAQPLGRAHRREAATHDHDVRVGHAVLFDRDGLHGTHARRLAHCVAVAGVGRALEAQATRRRIWKTSGASCWHNA